MQGKYAAGSATAFPASSLLPPCRRELAGARTRWRATQIIENDPHEFSASYHPTMGYPVSVSADPVENTIDEEWGVEAGGVEALPPAS